MAIEPNTQHAELVRVKAMLEAWRDWDAESGDPPPDGPLNMLSAVLIVVDHLLHNDGTDDER
jgi:hypothetical protein